MMDLPIFKVETEKKSGQPADSWTDHQRSAIKTTGGRLIVSASAGSGKTAVLTQRVIEKIKNGGDIGKMLIVTFTVAAAGEMRARIHEELIKLLAKNPSDRHLLRQSVLVSRAKICTIDAFCNDLTRRNFHLLDISPDYRIADAAEDELMSRAVLQEVVGEYYEKTDEDFLKSVQAFSSTKDDIGYFETVLSVIRWLDSLPYPLRQLESFVEMYNPQGENAALYSSIWFLKIAHSTLPALEKYREEYDRLLEDLHSDTILSDRFAAPLFLERNQMEQAISAAAEKKWEDFSAAIRDFSFDRVSGSLRSGYDVQLKNEIMRVRGELKELIKKLKNDAFAITPQQHKDDLQRFYPILKSMSCLIFDYYEQLNERKRQKGVLTFNDVSHLALKLLVEDYDEKSGTLHKTHLAAEYESEIDEIMLDEYQDTNMVQNLIFEAVSRGGNNIFCVGDIKQSIYRFRRAMPQIFIKALENAVPVGEGFPAAVHLSENFRSSAGVLDFVNLFFSSVMSRGAGEIEYDENHRANVGMHYPENDYTTEVDMIVDENRESAPEDEEAQSETEEEDLSGDYRQGLVCAQRICEMMSSGRTVYDKSTKGTRPLRYSDIAVLMRSANGHAPDFVKALAQSGIPAFSTAAANYFENYEVQFVLAFLAAVDNPYADIALAAALRSPLFGFSVQELSDLRAQGKKICLYACLKEYAAQGNLKAAQACESLAHYRRQAMNMPVFRLIWEIYMDFSLFALVGSLDFAPRRQKNLRQIYIHAQNYEKSSLRGLYGFLKYMDRIQENIKNAEGHPPAPSGDFVTVSTIHASKGLEYPIVFLCSMNRKFSGGDHINRLAMHDTLGIGGKVRDFEKKIEYTTMALEAIKLAEREEEIAEEQRILYVAMTRAREKLFLVLTVKPKGGFQKKLEGILSEAAVRRQASSSLVLGSGSSLDWLMFTLCRTECVYKLFERFDISHPHYRMDLDKTGINLRFIELSEIIQPDVPVYRRSVSSKVDMKAIKERLDYSYPLPGLSAVPAKLSVSDIKGMRMAEDDSACIFERASLRATPVFAAPEKPTALQRGNALHKFMQFSDVSIPDIDSQIKDLVGNGILSEQEEKMIDRTRLDVFWSSPLARRIRKAKRVENEYRFLSDIAAGEYDESLSGEAARFRVMLQGVVDLFFEEEDGIVLVDYKTDRLTDESAFAERYSTQLGLYADALERVLGKRVKEKIVYSFYLNHQIIL